MSDIIESNFKIIFMLSWTEGKVPKILNLTLPKKVSKQGLRCNPRLTFERQKAIRLAKLPPFHLFPREPLHPSTQVGIFIHMEINVTSNSCYCVALTPPPTPVGRCLFPKTSGAIQDVEKGSETDGGGN